MQDAERSLASTNVFRGHPKVLIVDDRDDNRLALNGVLESLEIEIVQASSGNEALAKLIDNTFCCILLDIEMPVLSGFDVAQILRDDPVLHSTPIIFMTAHRKGDFDVFKAYESGAVDYLFKPVEPTVVRSKVRVFSDLFRKQQIITELNQALLTANEDLRQFAKVAAHDLKEPARLIYSYSQLVEDSVAQALTPNAKSYMQVVRDNAIRIRTMLDDLVSLLNVRDSARERELIDLTRLVNEVLSELQDNVGDANIEVEKLPFIHAKRSEIKLVLTNLLANALKFRGGQNLKISVSGQHALDQTIITVRDNNPEIDRRYHDKVFELFQRLSREPSSENQTGLGLSLCRTIIEKHGGRIWIDPQNATGNAFCFCVPSRGFSTPSLSNPLR